MRALLQRVRTWAMAGTLPQYAPTQGVVVWGADGVGTVSLRTERPDGTAVHGTVTLTPIQERP
jgi:hypothetical protein